MDNIAIIVSILIYKLSSLITGVILCYFGYRLLLSTVTNSVSANIKLEFFNGKINVSKLTPGMLFSLFGAIILGFTMWKGIEIKKVPVAQNTTSVQSIAPTIKAP